MIFYTGVQLLHFRNPIFTLFNALTIREHPNPEGMFSPPRFDCNDTSRITQILKHIKFMKRRPKTIDMSDF